MTYVLSSFCSLNTWHISYIWRLTIASNRSSVFIVIVLMQWLERSSYCISCSNRSTSIPDPNESLVYVKCESADVLCDTWLQFERRLDTDACMFRFRREVAFESSGSMGVIWSWYFYISGVVNSDLKL